MAGLLAAVGTVGVAQRAVAASALEPVKTRPGGAPGGFTIRLPDGRLLHFAVPPVHGGHPPTTGGPPSTGPGSPGTGGSGSPTGSPSGSPTGTPSGTPSSPPSGAPSASGLPVPVVSSLFPSPAASGSHAHHRTTPSAHPSRSASAAAEPSATASADPQASASASAAPGGQGNDAVPPAAVPERPASTVPPPLGPQAVLQPDPLGQQLSAPRATPLGTAFAHRGRLLGVGLALIGTGAALFGWRIRRL